MAETAAEDDLPAPAVSAYGRAVLVLEAENPGCHLGWTTLAGIAAVESDHGQTGDRTLGPDGRSSRPVVGPALDGRGFAAVPATPESARWHGDSRWDHAVGALLSYNRSDAYVDSVRHAAMQYRWPARQRAPQTSYPNPRAFVA